MTMADEKLDLDPAIHLIRAGRELLAAAKSMIDGMDAYLAVLEEQRLTAGKPESKIQAIPIRREQTAP
jgi:hypothetical protein